MLTLRHPELFPDLVAFPAGLRTITLPDEPRPILVVKAPKEVLLTAQVNQGFLIYVVPIQSGSMLTAGLISAFFDDEDEPLTLSTPMSVDPERLALAQAIWSGSLDVYLFDEHNREWLGYEARVTLPPVAQARLSAARWLPATVVHSREQLDFMTPWFSVRSKAEDDHAIEVHFERALFPEDMVIQDLRTAEHDYHGNPGFSFSSLERTNPGAFQEDDIVRQLVRIFPAKEIFLNPLRTDDNKEVCDVLVVTKKRVLIIQAKDSPNTPAMLKKSLGRKRFTALNKLDDALSQVRGAVRYARRTSRLTFTVLGEEHDFDLGNRQVHALVVVKELFNDQMDEYWTLLSAAAAQSKVSCVALDYPELSMYASHLVGEDAFFGAYDRVYNFAQEHGHYPRLRLLPPE